MNFFATFSFSFVFTFLFFPNLKAQNSISEKFDQLSLQAQEPVPLNYPEICQSISYPEQAIEGGIEGIVQVIVHVDEQGRYAGHEVVGNSHPMLTSAVLPRLNCLSFVPAFEKGKAVGGWKAIAFRFQLLDNVRSGRSFKRPNFICPQPQDSDSMPIVNIN